jgi:hypothetical protein
VSLPYIDPRRTTEQLQAAFADRSGSGIDVHQLETTSSRPCPDDGLSDFARIVVNLDANVHAEGRV